MTMTNDAGAEAQIIAVNYWEANLGEIINASYNNIPIPNRYRGIISRFNSKVYSVVHYDQ